MATPPPRDRRDLGFADLTWAVSPDLDLSLSAGSTIIRASAPRTDCAPHWLATDADTRHPRHCRGREAAHPRSSSCSATTATRACPESSLSVELGIDRELRRPQPRATAFWIRVDDLIDFDSDSTACASPFGCYEQIPGETTTQGVELKRQL